MAKNLKLYQATVCGTRPTRISLDDARGESSYSGKYIVAANNEQEVIKKIKNKHSEHPNDRAYVDKELKAGSDIPLEKRLEILGELVPVIK